MEYSTGIARRTHEMVSIARDRWGRIQVAGTRKHFPGGKILSIAALRAGGGIIHRAGISDSILVFDQHRTLTRNPVHAVRRLMAMEPERKVCVEVDTPEDGMFWAARLTSSSRLFSGSGSSSISSLLFSSLVFSGIFTSTTWVTTRTPAATCWSRAGPISAGPLTSR